MAAEIPQRWPRLIGLFRWYVRGFFAKHFHALRIDNAGLAPDLGDRSAIVVLNHPTWWDPLVAGLLLPLFPHHEHFSPMDAAQLRQYRWFARMGFFPVEAGSTYRGLSFLRTCRAILARPRGAVWITAQGRFTDVRERPPRLRGGVGHLAALMPHVAIVPLAIEFPFWNDRLPEALAHFGPLVESDGSRRNAEEWTRTIEAALEQTQDRLAAAAMTRDATKFTTLLAGRSGINPMYDLWQRLRGRRTSP